MLRFLFLASLIAGCRTDSQAVQELDNRNDANAATALELPVSPEGEVAELVSEYVAYKYHGALLGGSNPASEPFWNMRALHDGPGGELVWAIDTFHVEHIFRRDDTMHVAHVRYPRAVLVGPPSYVGQARQDLSDTILVSRGLIYSYDEMVVGREALRSHIERAQWSKDDDAFKDHLNDEFANLNGKNGT